MFGAHNHGRRMTNQRTTRRIHNNDRRSRCSFHRSLRHSCLLPLAAGPSRPPPRPRRPDLEARRPRPSASGRQRAAGGPAETIWRCGSARGSAGRGAQRGRPTARRTWGKTVRDKRRLSQVPAAQASAADECRCGGLGVGPLIIPRASHPPPADVHWGGGLGGTVGYAAWSAWTASTGYLWATERDVGERTVCPAREM